MTTFTLPDGDNEVTFFGERLATASSHHPGKPRWFEVTIYRTETGKYVIAGAGKSAVAGETDRCWVKVSETASGAVEALHQYDDDGVRYLTNVSREALNSACAADDELCQEYRLQRIK